MKRSLPPLRLKQSPLVMVLTQVRFSPVMSLEKFIPEIQEQLRKKGFPRFLRGQVQEFLLQAEGPPKFTFSERFDFQDKTASLGITLTTNSIAVQTNKYTNYESFEEGVATALIIANRVLNLALVERIGLRYVDLVRPGKDETLSEYLKPGLLGVDLENLGIARWMSRYEALGKTNLGKLVVKCSQSEQILPVDLFPATLDYSNIVLQPGEIVTLLDFDHFTEESADFDTQAVVSRIGELHDAVDIAFRNAVTPEALVKWGTEEAL